jgi:tetratricopeptide (TPR) repeat protein
MNEQETQVYLQFLLELLHKINSDSSREFIYPFLTENLDKLDQSLIVILEKWAKKTLQSCNLEESYNFAIYISNFSDLIQEFPLGNIATNLEIAIIGYQIVLSIFTLDAYPEEWATTQHNLGRAYSCRIRADKADSLEKAITAYTEALKVYNFEHFPKHWATTKNNLGNIYINRIKEDKANNLEKAITVLNEALKVINFEDFPEYWADTKNNLGNAYLARIKGDEADNLEKAITCYTQALKIRTFEDFPEDWAKLHNNLGNSYLFRIRGDEADNLEKAITFYTQALKVKTFDSFPKDWANIQNNLGNSYLFRIRGDKADNLEKAIAFYTQALKVRTFEDFPEDWADTQNNLAITYAERIQGDKAENSEKSCNYYQNALQGYETAGDWLNAAEIALTLGKIYVDRGEWYKGLDYLEKSLTIHRQFEDLPSRADTIYQIARTNHLIGNYEKASVHYRDALRFYNHLKNLRGAAFCRASLGRILLQTGFVKEAKTELEAAKMIFIDLKDSQEITKINEVLNCITQIEEKQAA